MKKLFIAPTVVFIVTSSVAEAYENKNFSDLMETSFEVRALDDLRFEVSAANIESPSAVEIRDEDGYTLYKEEVRSGAFVKVFDLDSLHEGQYRVLLSSGEKTMFKSFEIKIEKSIAALAS